MQRNFKRPTLSWLAVLFCFSLAPAKGQLLPDSVAKVVESFRGELYFAAKDLSSGQVLEYRGDAAVQTASVIKVPVLIELFAQASERRLILSDVVAYTGENRVPGTGILQDLGPGLHLTLRDLAVLMTVLSDNTATNVLIDRLSLNAINGRLQQLGLPRTRLFKKVFKEAPPGLNEEEKKWGLGVTTPREMMQLMEKLHRKELVDMASSEAMLEILSRQRNRDNIPRYLYGEAWKDLRIAHKTGALNRVRNDVGIVYTPDGDYILSLFAQQSEDQKWTPDNAASLALGQLAKAILLHFR